jgi:hypothetical protein
MKKWNKSDKCFKFKHKMCFKYMHNAITKPFNERDERDVYLYYFPCKKNLNR